MAKNPEHARHEAFMEVPTLVDFLNTKPDEELKIQRLQRPDITVPTVEIIKLETPLGTDDVGSAGYMRVTKDSLQPSVDYLVNLDLTGKSDYQVERLFLVIRQVLNIQNLLV